MKKSMLLWVMLGLLFATCSKDTESQFDIDVAAIEQYLADNNIDAEKHDSGLYYVIDEPGSGGSPGTNSEVLVKYKGSLLDDGTVFDETTGSAVNFQLSNLITGWRIGVPLLEKEGKGTFYIPSVYGYGSFGQGDIPPNANLIFEIELVDFN